CRCGPASGICRFFTDCRRLLCRLRLSLFLSFLSRLYLCCICCGFLIDHLRRLHFSLLCSSLLSLLLICGLIRRILMYSICLLTAWLRAHDAQLERALQDPRDHAHILLLEVIPPQSLRQVLSGHLLPSLRFDRLCQLLDRHAFSSKNDLDLFTKC